MVSRKMKYVSIASIGLMTLSLGACASNTQEYRTMGDSGLKTVEQSKYKDQCKEPELQKDGSYKCEEEVVNGGGAGGVATGGANTNHSSTSIIPFWLFNGQRYDSQSAMVASSDYKKNNLVNGTKYKNTKTDARKSNNSKSKSSSKSSSGKSSSSGFGSGGRGTSGGS